MSFQFSRPPGGGVYADEMSPEDIFNMFFGGGYPQQHVRRRTQRRAPPPQDWRQQVAQLIPLLFLCLIMFGNSGSLYDPPFSLKRTAKFRHERLTRSRGVVPDIRYYVADGFSAKHARDGYALRRQEQNVESEYQTHLRYGCFSARQRRSQFVSAAQFSPRRRELMEQVEHVAAAAMGSDNHREGAAASRVHRRVVSSAVLRRAARLRYSWAPRAL